MSTGSAKRGWPMRGAAPPRGVHDRCRRPPRRRVAPLRRALRPRPAAPHRRLSRLRRRIAASNCSAACSPRSRRAVRARTTAGGTTCSTPIAASRATRCPGVALKVRFRDAEVAVTQRPRGLLHRRVRHARRAGRRSCGTTPSVSLADGTLATPQPVLQVGADAGVRRHLRHRRHRAAERHHRLEDRRAADLPAQRAHPQAAAMAWPSCTRRCRPAPTAAAGNPIFYVSSSPWNLYDLLEDFMELNAIPCGPIFLRDIGTDAGKFIKTPGHGHKLERARELIERFPTLRWVLLGDSGPGRRGAVCRSRARVRRPHRRDLHPRRRSGRRLGLRHAASTRTSSASPARRCRCCARATASAIAEHAAGLGLIAARRHRRHRRRSQARPATARPWPKPRSRARSKARTTGRPRLRHSLSGRVG